MKPGELKTIVLPPEQAYGTYDEEMIMVMNRDELEEYYGITDPEVGQKLWLDPPDAPPISVEVIDVNDWAVTLDGNHPLAGEDVTFDIILDEIILN